MAESATDSLCDFFGVLLCGYNLHHQRSRGKKEMTITVPMNPGTVLNALHTQLSSMATKKRFISYVLMKKSVSDCLQFLELAELALESLSW